MSRRVIYKVCPNCGKEVGSTAFTRHLRACKEGRLIKEAVGEKDEHGKTKKWYDAMASRKGNGTNQFKKARQLGLPCPPSKLKGKKFPNRHLKMSDEQKKKISESRIKYLKENPDKVPYLLNHSSKESYPEKYFRSIFKKELDEGTLCSEYRVGLYSLDIANVDKKVDFEIDGDQHYLDKKIVESDIKRNEYLKNLGWTMVRLKWSDYQKLSFSDKKDKLNEIKKELLNS